MALGPPTVNAPAGRPACRVNISPPTALKPSTVNAPAALRKHMQPTTTNTAAQIGRLACLVNLSLSTALGPPTAYAQIVSREHLQPLKMQSGAKYAPLPPTRTPVLETAPFVPVVLIWKRMVHQRMIALFVQQENIWKPAITEYTMTHWPIAATVPPEDT